MAFWATLGAILVGSYILLTEIKVKFEFSKKSIRIQGDIHMTDMTLLLLQKVLFVAYRSF